MKKSKKQKLSIRARVLNRRFIVRALYVLFVLFLINANINLSSDKDRLIDAKAFTAGYLVQQYVENYHQKHGEYPEDLSGLPSHLSELMDKNRLFYSLIDDDLQKYEIIYVFDYMELCLINHQSSIWDCSRKKEIKL